MINSDFDTIIRSNNDFSNKKKSKIGIFIIIFFLIILIIAGIIGYKYYSEYKSNIPKIKFFEYIDDTSASKIVDTTLFESIIQKISNTSFSAKSELILETQDESIKLPNLKLNYNKNSNNTSSAEMIFNKSENDEIIKFSFLSDNENIGIKCDDIVIKYVGSKKENVNTLIAKYYSNNKFSNYLTTNQDNLEQNIFDTTESLQQDNSNTATNEQLLPIDFPQQDVIVKYKDILNNKLNKEKFTIEENVLLTQNEGSMQTTLYELKITKEELLQILTELKNQFVNDESLIECLITGIEKEENDKYTNINNLKNGYKINYSQEQIIEKIETYFNNIYTSINDIQKFDYMYIDIYVNNGIVVKKSLRIGDIFEIFLEEQKKSDNEYTAKITILKQNENDNKDAIIFTINRLDNNVSTIIDFEISMTEKGTINKKIITNFILEGNQNSTNLNNKISVSYSDMNTKISANINSDIQIGYEEEIETLNSENCYFLDEFSDDDFNNSIKQIIEKSKEVFQEKSRKLFEEETSSEEQNNTVDKLINMDGQTVEEIEKQKAQNTLIEAISEQMRIAESEGREYTLADVQSLEILGSTVSVMLGENMAIVAIDGYTFYIDPNFVLTTE